MNDPSSPQQRGFGHSRRRVAAEVGILAGGLLLLVGLGLWLSSSAAGWLTPWVPRELDVAIGRASFAALAPEASRCRNEAPLRYVESVAEALRSDAASEFELHFTVVDDASVNAYALPGGFVAVHSGLLKAAKSGEEVAGVLAHELAHVSERHGTRRVLRALGAGALLSALFGGTDIEAAAGLLTQLVSTAYDREQEEEADRVGLETLERSGIDPTGLSDFFQRLARGGPVVPELLSTHPDPGGRAQRAQAAATRSVTTTRLQAPPDASCH